MLSSSALPSLVVASLLLLLTSQPTATASAMDCEYTDSEDYLYDFSELTRDNNDYQLLDATRTYIYRINVCQGVQEQACKAQNGIACQYQLDVNNPSTVSLVKVLATVNDREQWTEDDDNIYQTFNGKGLSSVQFKYECIDPPPPGQQVQPILSPDSTEQNHIFQFSVPHACADYLNAIVDPQGNAVSQGPSVQEQRPGHRSGNVRDGPPPPGGKSSSFFGPDGPAPRGRHGGWHTSTILAFTIFILAIVYFVGGIMWNRHKDGSSGVDALPHSEFWMTLPGLVVDGFYYTKDNCVLLYEKMRGTSSGSARAAPAGSNNYDQI